MEELFTFLTIMWWNFVYVLSVFFAVCAIQTRRHRKTQTTFAEKQYLLEKVCFKNTYPAEWWNLDKYNDQIKPSVEEVVRKFNNDRWIDKDALNKALDDLKVSYDKYVESGSVKAAIRIFDIKFNKDWTRLEFCKYWEWAETTGCLKVGELTERQLVERLRRSECIG